MCKPMSEKKNCQYYVKKILYERQMNVRDSETDGITTAIAA